MAGALTPSLAPAAVKLSGGRRVNRAFSAPIGPPCSASAGSDVMAGITSDTTSRPGAGAGIAPTEPAAAETTLDLARFAEVLKTPATARDVLGGKQVKLGATLQLPPRSVGIFELRP